MAHVVYVDKGDHFEVIADYSRSVRHARLSAEQWLQEYTTDRSYDRMRKETPASTAGVVPFGVGRWKKDWSGPYRLSLAAFELSSYAERDFDDVPAVESGTSKTHRIMVMKSDEDGKFVGGKEEVRILVSAPVAVSISRLHLSEGLANFEVGPCPHPCDLVVTAADPSNVIRKGNLKIRFK